MGLREKRLAAGVEIIPQERGKRPTLRRKPPEDGAFEVQTEEKTAGFKRNFVVKTPMARIQKEKRKGGRSHKKTPRQMRNGINSYFGFCEDNDRTPSISGMMLHLKMGRDQFYKYMAYPEYQDIMEQAKLIINEWVANDIYRTPGQAAGKIAYAKNIHGWAEKVDTTSVNETRITQVLTVDEARTKIASLAHLIDPALLESVTRSYTRNQLTHVEAEVVGE